MLLYKRMSRETRDDMLLHSSHLVSETTVTVGTLEWFFTGVRAHVPLQMTDIRERLVALSYFALERLLSGVNSLFGQNTELLTHPEATFNIPCGSSSVPAVQRPLNKCYKHRVALQCGFVRDWSGGSWMRNPAVEWQRFAAQLARWEFPLSGYLEAVLALVRTLSIVLAHVHFQVTLLSKMFLADTVGGFKPCKLAVRAQRIARRTRMGRALQLPRGSSHGSASNVSHNAGMKVDDEASIQ